MADRSLRFNVFANDKASRALENVADKIDKVANRITGLNGKRAIAKVEVKIAEAERKLKQAEERLKLLERTREVNLDAQTARATEKLAVLSAQLDELASEREVRFDVKTQVAKEQLRDFEHELANLENERHDALIGISSKEGEIEALRAKLVELGKTKATPTIDIRTAAIKSQIAKLKKEIGDLGKLSPEVRVEIRANERKLTTLQRQLDRLGAQAPSIEVDMQTALVEAKIARIKQMIQTLSRTEPIELTANTARLDEKIRLAKARLDQLEAERTYPQLDANSGPIMAEIAEAFAELEALDRERAEPTIDANTAAAQAKILALKAAIAGLDDKKVRIKLDIDGGFQSILGALGKISLGFINGISRAGQFARALGVIVVPIGIAALIPALVSLGATLQETIGILGLVPGGVAAAGLAFGTLAIGFSGFKDAMAKLDTPKKLEKYNEALRDMAPNARAVVAVLRGFANEWTKVRNAVQQPLFARIAGDLKELGRTYLPVLARGFALVADGFNRVFRDIAWFFKMPETVANVNALFRFTGEAVGRLGPGLRYFAEAFFDMAYVGASMLPGMADGFSAMMERFRDFIAQARADGSFAEWIIRGRVALSDLWGALKATGRVISDVFEASRMSGYSFVKTWRHFMETIEQTTSSMSGKLRIADMLKGMNDAVDLARAGLRALFSAIAQGIEASKPTIRALADTFSVVMVQLESAFAQIAYVSGVIFVPLLAYFRFMAEAFGGVIIKVIALAVAWRALNLVMKLSGFTALVAGLAGMSSRLAAVSQNAAMATYGTTRFGGAAAAASTSALRASRMIGTLGSVLGSIGRALPLIGLAIIAVMLLNEEFGSKAKENGEKAAQGFKSYQKGLDDTMAQSRRLRGWIDTLGTDLNRLQTWIGSIGDGLGGLGGKFKDFGGWIGTLGDWANKVSVFLDVVEFQKYQKAWDETRAKMSEVQKVQADLVGLEEALNVARAGGNQDEVARLEGLIAEMRVRLKDETIKASDAEKDYADRIRDTMKAHQESADAAQGILDAQVALENAEKNYNEVQKDTKKSAAEKKQALGEVVGAMLGLAEKESEGIISQAKLAGAYTTTAQQATVDKAASEGYRAKLEELYRTALPQYKGALAEQLVELKLQSVASGEATNKTDVYKSAIDLMQQTVTAKYRPALADLKVELGNIERGTGTATEKQEAMRLKVLEVAGKVEEPFRRQLLLMAEQLKNIPPGKVNVTADGKMNPPTWMGTGVASKDPTDPGRKSSNAGGFADGGVLPGYTPGVDVHRFASATGGFLDLSGGEAVMRPEFTRVVGDDFVNQANEAARISGTKGVRDFMKRGPLREGVEGDSAGKYKDGGIIPHQRFAEGGFVQTGLAPVPLAQTTIAAVANAMMQRMRALMVTRMKAEIAAAKAAMAAGGGGAASGPVTAGAGAGLAWARTQVGKHYQMGGVGPNVYDCSGFMSAIVNIMRGRYPHSRVGATGSFPWPGFVGGIGPGLNIGSFRGSPGHMAGTIGGTNVESSGGVGVRVGGGARGAGHSMFNTRAHLADGGGMVRHGDAGLNLSGRAERMLTGRQNDTYERAVAMAERGQYSGSPDVVQAVRELASAMRAAGNTYNQTFPITGSPKETAAAVSKSDRVTAALGAWGSR